MEKLVVVEERKGRETFDYLNFEKDKEIKRSLAFRKFSFQKN